MRRLLWKEWHELRWYLIGFLFGPWLAAWWGNRLNNGTPQSVSDPLFWAMTILLSFVAATRLSKDVRAEYMSVQWLPVNRWAVWLTKFIPGFIVAVLLPLWIRWVVTVVADANPALVGMRIDQGSDGIEVSTAVYACVFAASMFLPSLAAVLVGIFAACTIAGYMSDLLAILLSANACFAAQAVVATAVSVGAWRRPAGAGARSRASSAGVAALLGLIPALGLGFLIAVHESGGLQVFARNYDLYRATQLSWYTTSGRPWNVSAADDIVSADGKYVAHMAELWTRPGTRNRLEITDAHGHHVEVPDPTAVPAAWLPNGRFLVCTGSMGREMILNEFDPRTNRLTPLASFPPPKRGKSYAPIEGVFPEPSGNRVALVVSPRVGIGSDIWVLDMHTKALRILLPGVSFSDDLVWDGDDLVVLRMGDYWRIPSDGSAPRRVTVSMKEASGD